MGACEMGQPTAFADVPPSNWWNFTSFTAAINSQNFNYGTANTTAYGDLGNCGGACNQCYRLTPTGGHVDGQGASPSNTDPMIIMVSNLCPGPANTQWCNASQPYGYCKDNPSECQQQEGYTNTYGYSAHFDLEDQEGQISSATAGLGWDNPEVTFEEVDCSGWYDQVNASAPYQMDLGDTASTSGPSWVPSANDTEPMTKCGAYASLTCEAGEEQVFVKDEFVSSSCSTNSASTGDIYLCNGTSQGALVSAALTTFDAISPLCLPTGTTQLVMYPCAENWSAWTVKVTPGGTTILSSSTGQSGTCNF